jgi:2-methylisocitrate lyase-like PEP mutase family enzyme
MKHDPGPAFRALHQRGNPFVLMNAWDRGSARVLAALGAQALATTSAGHAFTLGVPDGQVTRDQAMAHAADLVSATPLPVSADFENGFGEAPDDVAETIRLGAEAGLAGCSVEDCTRNHDRAYDQALAVERVRAAVAAARALNRDFVVVARADGFMNKKYDLDEAIRRLQAFESAGADCVYAPWLADLAALKRVCASVKGPVNALALGPFTGMSRADFGAAGVARISIGSGLSKVTQRILSEVGSSAIRGNFSGLANLATGMDALLRQGMRADN